MVNLTLAHDSAMKFGPKRCSQHRPALTNLIAEGSRMATRELPSPELLRKLIDYNPDTGILVWREREAGSFEGGSRSAAHQAAIFNTTFAGRPALATLYAHGYLRGRVMNQTYAAHRVAWAIHYGEWPQGEVDHINGNPSDNRIQNLRSVSHIENSRNQKRSVNNTSGTTGVSWNKQCRKWSANIRAGGKRLHLGLFANFEDATFARKEAERRFGFHSNHGRTAPKPVQQSLLGDPA